jgi:tRNA A37 N6-isopentenylltransferase MiaA
MSWLSNTLGSVAGSVLGSAVQNHYNSANAAQANAWNVENYKHRYQWAVEDMRNAGLNPILAATNGIGGSISGASAASVGMSDIGSTMNSAKAASAAERQAKNAEHLAISQIDKNVAEADSVRQRNYAKERAEHFCIPATTTSKAFIKLLHLESSTKTVDRKDT